MSHQTGKQTVQEIYGAFGRGDLDAILERTSDDVTWDQGGDPAIPWMGVHRGRAGVRAFFEALGTHVRVDVFTPHTFVEDDGVVVAICDARSTIRKTGRDMALREVHVFRFDAAGRVREFSSSYDTAVVLDAWRG